MRTRSWVIAGFSAFCILATPVSHAKEMAAKPERPMKEPKVVTEKPAREAKVVNEKPQREPKVDLFPKYNPSADSQANKAAEMSKVRERMRQEKVKEDMRDKTHDYRLKAGKDTSVGVGKDGVNVIKTIP